MESGTFEMLARMVMSSHYGVPLPEGRVPGVPKRWDYLESAHQVVGDAKNMGFYEYQSNGGRLMEIAGHVWLLNMVPAEHRFLIFGKDRRMPEMWLRRFGQVAGPVEFYFLTESGELERLR